MAGQFFSQLHFLLEGRLAGFLLVNLEKWSRRNFRHVLWFRSQDFLLLGAENEIPRRDIDLGGSLGLNCVGKRNNKWDGLGELTVKLCVCGTFWRTFGNTNSTKM